MHIGGKFISGVNESNRADIKAIFDEYGIPFTGAGDRYIVLIPPELPSQRLERLRTSLHRSISSLQINDSE